MVAARASAVLNMLTNQSILNASAIDAQRALCHAIQTLNWATLEGMLADELHYIHSFGRVDSKADLLRNIARFTACSRWQNEELKEQTFENISVLTSNLHAELHLPDGTQQTSQQRAVDVWHRTANGWKLVSHQSTAFK
jgi:hypothetical protein